MPAMPINMTILLRASAYSRYPRVEPMRAHCFADSNSAKQESHA
jgi:hypothetical protein